MLKRLFGKFSFLSLLYAVVFLYVFLMSAPEIQSLCNYFPNEFDGQNYLMWAVQALQHALPFRDTAYPYGYLRFWQCVSPVYQLIAVGIIPASVVIMMIVMKRLIKSRIYLSVSWILFGIFVAYQVYYINYYRYGLFVSLACLFVLVLFGSKKITITTLGMGIATGFLMVLIPDQGMYLAVANIAMLLLLPLLQWSTVADPFLYIYGSTRRLIEYAIGLCFVLLPFAILLVHTGSVQGFEFYIQEFSSIPVYAKTLFVFSRTTGGITNFVVVWLSIIVVVTKLVNRTTSLKTRDQHIFTGIQGMLILCDLLLEQKNLIRPIGQQHLFITFILVVLLLEEFRRVLPLPRFKHKFFSAVISAYLLVVFLLLLDVTGHNWFERFTILPSDPAQTLSHLHRPDTILKSNIGRLLKGKSYIQQKEVLSYFLKKKPIPRIFSFPYDPVLYVLFNQKPPTVFNLYNASSYTAQAQQIEYIKKSRTQYVLYNFNYPAVDAVPDYIRGKSLLKYILTHSSIAGKIGSFYLLKMHSENIPFFSDKNMTENTELMSYLLVTNFGAIPRTEAAKYSRLSDPILLASGSISQVNAYLQQHSVFTDNLIIRVRSSSSLPFEISIKSGTNEARIIADNCGTRGDCLFNISNAPLFYNRTRIDSLETSSKYELLELVKIGNTKALW